ncbi:MAG: leucine-rich repeat protein [Lachnospiraceae bacterium]|nr:leucine-rich repeat protein [Lachnospiraceae bacterium]
MKRYSRFLSFIMVCILLLTNINLNVYALEVDDFTEEVQEYSEETQQGEGMEEETLSENDIPLLPVSGNDLLNVVTTGLEDNGEMPPSITERNDILAFEVTEVDFDEIEELSYEADELIDISENTSVYSENHGEYWDQYTGYYIYNQLSEPEQKLWRGMEILYSSYLEDDRDILDGFTEYITVRTTEISMYDLIGLAVMFKYTHPQYYFLSSGFKYATNGISVGIAFGVYDNFLDGSVRKRETLEIAKVLEECVEMIQGKSTEEEKVRAIHDWICNKVDYNDYAYDLGISPVEQTEYTQTAYSVFRMNRTVCAGYALAFMWLCNATGVDAFAVTSPGHAYNKVKVDDSWYNMDLTWNDGYGKGNFYYWYYLRSEYPYFNDESHNEESYWLEYLPECNLDSGATWYKPGTLPVITETTAVPEIHVTTTSTGHTVSMTSETPGAKIYYTLDGRSPSESSTRSFRYRGPFTINDTVTIRAMAVCDGKWDSNDVSKEIEVVDYDEGMGNYGNLTWHLDSTGCLHIEGSGTMPDAKGSSGIPWYTYKDKIKKIVLADTITSIGAYAFVGLERVTDITIPKSVTSIGNNAFELSGLTKIVIPDTIASIGAYAFYNCYDLREVVIEGNVENFGQYIFYNCIALINVTLSDDLETLGEGMFEYCSSLKEIVLPQNLNSIGKYAFEYCEDLREVVLPEGLKIIWDYAFGACSNLKELYIPASVTSIGNYIFYTDVTIIGHKGSMAQSYARSYHLTFIDAESVSVLVNFVTNTAETIEPRLTVRNRKILPPKMPAKTGYEFAGWYTSASEQEEINKWNFNQHKVKQAMTLYAKWMPKTYQLRYDLNYENAPVLDTKKVTYDAPYGELPQNPSRKGYHFAGWYSAADGGTAIKESTVYRIDGDSSIYAKWEPCTYIISLDANGGELEIEEIAVRYKETYVNLPTPKSAGKTFIGWYTEPVGGQRITTDTIVEVTQDQMLYARWEKNTKAATPISSAETGSVLLNNTKVTLETDTYDADIYYTLNPADGEGINESNRILYRNPIVISENCTLYAYAVHEDYLDSEVACYTYTVIDASEDQGDISAEDWLELQQKLEITSLDQVPNNYWIAGVKNKEYTGKAITQESLRVYYYKTLLTQNVDYKVKYSGNVNAGEAKITITGKGEYSGKYIEYFEILPLDLEKAVLEKQVVDMAYTGKVERATNKISYVLNGKEISLRKGRDFEYRYPKTDKNSKDYDAQAFQEVGTYTVYMDGKGNYTGSISFIQTITKKIPVKKLILTRLPSMEYTGEALTPAIELKDGSKVLGVGTDYDLVYQNNKEIGTASIIITGKGEYTGSRTTTFKITGRNLKDATISGMETKVYQGVPVIQKGYQLQYEQPDGNIISLVEGEDYVVSYRNNTKAGTATMSFIGIHHYSGTINKYFTIRACDLNDAIVQVEAIGDQIYRRDGVMPKPVVILKVDGRNKNSNSGSSVSGESRGTEEITLVEGVDYTLSYRNYRNVGMANSLVAPTIIITGKGGFVGNRTVKYNIKAAQLASCKVTAKDVDYQKEANSYKTSVVVMDSWGNTLVAGKDYHKEISYTYVNDTNIHQMIDGKMKVVVRDAGEEVNNKDILPAGTKILALVTGKGNYVGQKGAMYRVVNRGMQVVKPSYIDDGVGGKYRSYGRQGDAAVMQEKQSSNPYIYREVLVK